MTRQELLGVVNDLSLEIVEVDEAAETVTVWNGKRAYRVFLQKLEGENVSEMRELFEGKREEDMLWVLSRVVGYFAFTHNMGKSRLQEVTDRRKADYSFPGEINNNPIGHVMMGDKT